MNVSRFLVLVASDMFLHADNGGVSVRISHCVCYQINLKLLNLLEILINGWLRGAVVQQCLHAAPAYKSRVQLQQQSYVQLLA